MIKNGYGIRVGQLVGDGVEIVMQPIEGGTPTFPDDEESYAINNNLINYNKRILEIQNASAGVEIKVCIKTRSDIPVSYADFPHFGWASTLDYQEFLAFPDLNVTIEEGYYCTNISSSIRLFPVALSDGWLTKREQDGVLTSRQVAYFSVLGALFWIIAILSVIDLIWHFSFGKISLQSFVMVFVTLHSIDRGNFLFFVSLFSYYYFFLIFFIFFFFIFLFYFLIFIFF